MPESDDPPVNMLDPQVVNDNLTNIRGVQFGWTAELVSCGRRMLCASRFASPLKLQWAAARLQIRLAAVFRDAGLDPDAHLRVTPWLPCEQFLGFLDKMDVYLDCPGFSGYTTAWQAVHRGMPLVTLEGDFLRQRLAAGLLRQIGVTDGIVSSREAYVETAVRFAQRCRAPKTRARCRESMCAAAAKADANLAAVRSIERALIAAVEAQR